MEKITLMESEFDDCIAIDENGCLNDSLDGKYGYRVFYNVSPEFIKASGYFTEDQMLGDDFVLCGGQVEFTVTAGGEKVGETLLWISVEDFENGGIKNTDFVDISEVDIIELIDDFNNRQEEKEL